MRLDILSLQLPMVLARQLVEVLRGKTTFSPKDLLNLVDSWCSLQRKRTGKCTIIFC